MTDVVTAEGIPTHAVENIRLERCVIVLNQSLTPGRAANAAAVIALTIGQRHPQLVGQPLVDASDVSHPGLIPLGIAVLSGSGTQLRELRQKAAELGNIDLIDFPVQGQQTKNYASFQEAVAIIPLDDMDYSGVALVGAKKAISKIVADLALFG
ncbi:hypothetical protein ASE93_03865 [Serratia sp. Leaf50]|nr:hypothetical protein ASE93_03865 [Serratia sp. Leaf50]